VTDNKTSEQKIHKAQWGEIRESPD